MEKKIIAVAGATGAQGGGLVRAILADPSGGFAVRALTRDPASAKAKDLAAAGAEVVAANLDDGDSLARAFAGAYGAFCVTFFWDHFSPEKEMAHARNMAQAAKQAKLQHVIWSTLEDTRLLVPLEDTRMPTLQERFKVPHFDGKGASNHFFTDLGVRADGGSAARLEDMSLEEVEAFLIKKAMARYGNVSHAARALGLSRSALYRRLERYKL